MQVFEFGSPGKTTVVLDGEFIRVIRKGFLNMMNHGLDGEKALHISSISAVQFKDAGSMTNGYIQFTLLGGKESKGGLFAATSDENTIMFTKNDRDKALQIRDYAESMIVQRNQPSVQVQSVSAADEILKLKSLLDAGIITQYEFDAKKKQLLGI